MRKNVGLEKLLLLIADPSKPVFLRGEVWVAREVLAAVGFSQDPKGLVELASTVGADICFFPWSQPWMFSDLKEMVELSHGAGMGCGVTMDGPFQRLSREKGLLPILKELGRGSRTLQSHLAKETESIAEGLKLTKDSGIDLVVIGDDIAYGSGLYFSPALFRELLVPSYRILANQISKTISVWGWHSDGDVSTILPDLVDCGFRFFSLESESVDLLNFKRTYGNRVTLIGGIRTAWLTQEGFDLTKQKEYREEIKTYGKEGGLILSSSCGLYHPNFLHALKEIYQWVEGADSGIVESQNDP
jgi:hypothetical protein